MGFFVAMQVMEITDQVYGQIIIASYGLAALHFWTQRGLRMTRGFLAECEFYLRLLRKFMGFTEQGLTEEAQKRVHERRRISLQEIASLWSVVLDLFVLCLFVFQAIGASPPMINSKCFFVTVSVGSTVMRRMGDPEVDLTPERLNRDMTIMSLLVFGATLGMPRELMPACYMARMLCFTFTNSQISNKVNIFLAPFYVISHWLNEQPNAPVERLLFSMVGEMVAVALMILVVTNLDTKERHAAVATLELEAKVKEVQEAEQEGGAAQRLLSVTCDAFVRLTHDLKIKTPSRSLLDMLMCHFGSNNAKTLDGMLFSRYIAPQDQQRFTDFIAESSQANAPARSLHVDMKDSSGVTFSAELFHVTVPSLTSEHEHLIGISNDSSGDRLERLEHTDAQENLTKEPQPLPSMDGDMRHILGHRFRQPHLDQASSRSRLSHSSRSSSNSSGGQLDLKKLKSLEKVNVIIDVGSVEDDYMIRSLSLTFNIPENCDIKLLPNLMEWLKPNHRKKVSDWIQSHANAQYAGRPCKEPSLRGTKMTSPFPATNTLLVGELKFAGVSDVFPEGKLLSPRVLSPMRILHRQLGRRNVYEPGDAAALRPLSPRSSLDMHRRHGVFSGVS